MTWAEHVDAWSAPPVDDIGYVPSLELLAYTDDQLRDTVEGMRQTRYDLDGWRNHRNLWRETLGLDTTHGKHVLDFGCGVGLEALQFAEAGNSVALADLSEPNLQIASRVLRLYGYEPTDTYLVRDSAPYADIPAATFDVFYCNGVLHHIPWAQEIMAAAHRWLRETGEARLMLYTDRGWTWATGTEPPTGAPEEHPAFDQFVRRFDRIGGYADWYNQDKILTVFGDLFDIKQCDYITLYDIYLTCTLVKNPGSNP